MSGSETGSGVSMGEDRTGRGDDARPDAPRCDNSGITFTHWDRAERLATPAGEAASWKLGYDEDHQRPGFMHVRWGPNERSPEHRHKSWTANIVIRGPLKVTGHRRTFFSLPS